MEGGNQTMSVNQPEIDNLVLNEVQLILSEKRTALSLMRTGIAVFALPLSVLSVLIATSRYYAFMHVLHFMIPVLVLCAGLIALGTYLVFRAVTRIRHLDQLLFRIKAQYQSLAEIV
jgi:hypothetical protein